MENVGEVMTASVPSNIAGDMTAPKGDVFESGLEMDREITGFIEPDTAPVIEAGVDVANPDYVDTKDEDALASEADYREQSLEEAREELEREMEEEPQSEETMEEERKDKLRGELETLNATIRLLELQRDALRKQLGSTLSSVISEMAKIFFANTFSEDREERGAETVDGPTEAWKDSARIHLRDIEKKILELKEQRGRLVANQMS